jgi:alpha-tubulin suppressor-like RCC1 family protein
MARFLSLRLSFIVISSFGGVACTALLGNFEVSATSGAADSGPDTTGTADAPDDVVNDSAPDGAVPGLSGVRQIAAGARHTCALANLGEVYCWGDNSLGQLAQPPGITRLPKPKKIDFGNTAGAIKAISAGGNHTCIITGSDDIQCWGGNACGQSGFGDFNNPAPPGRGVKATTAPTTRQWALLSGGLDHTCAVDQGGQTYCFGCNPASQIGIAGAGPFPYANNAGADKTPFKDIAAGPKHTCAITSDTKQVKCWGTEDKGSLGNGPPANETSAPAVSVTIPGEQAQIVVGGAHSCALNATGDIHCWGDNAFGQIGAMPAGSFLDAPPVMKVGNLNVVEIAAGGDTSCGIIQLGRTLACMGSNSAGQLGRGGVKDATPHADPAPVIRPGADGQPLDGVAHVAVGREHACAIVGVEGKVVCWGNGTDGQLGDGTAGTGNEAKTVPVFVALPD